MSASGEAPSSTTNDTPTKSSSTLQISDTPSFPSSSSSTSSTKDAFPTHLPLYDAHCHPTDTMQHTSSIPGMKARALIIMATRRQDQELVSEVTQRYGVGREHVRENGTGGDAGRGEEAREEGVIPSYGFHPWFSHQIYDDSDPTYTPTSTSTSSAEQQSVVSALPETDDKLPPPLTQDQHTAHYRSVLTPSPSDETFMASLPPPMPLSNLLSQTRIRLQAHPLALVGEVGLDRQFRLPEAWLPGEQEAFQAQDTEGLTPGGREGRKLSPYRVSMEHQKVVLRRQLELAGELDRAVSVHGVQCHGAVWEVLSSLWKGYEKTPLSKRKLEKRNRKREETEKQELSQDSTSKASANVELPLFSAHRDELDQGAKQGEEDEMEGEEEDEKEKTPYPPRICLHSFSGPPDQAKLYLSPAIPAEIYFSFSLAINFPSSFDNDDSSEPSGAEKKAEEVIKMLPASKILIESDMHIAGDRMDGNLRGMARKICEIRGWGLEEGVRVLARNWEGFVFGGNGR